MTHMNGEPIFVVGESQLTAIDGSLSTMSAIPGSRMFEIKEALAVYREHSPCGEEIDASQGDGGASLPGVPAAILEAAFRLQKDHGCGYDKPFGTPLFRRSVVEDYWGLDASTGWGPTNIIACQGGRDALLKAYDAIQFLGHGRRGDCVVVSRVPWISYNWGPYAVGSNVMLAPGREEDGWAMSPEGVTACVTKALAAGERKVAAVVVTSPDNPTGRVMDLASQVVIARAAFACGIPYVLFDWIYHRVTDAQPYDLNHFLGLFDREERERLIVLDGITKSLGGSNIRNAHLVASESIVRFIQSRASHGVIPSFFSQAVAIAAYREGFDRVAASIVGPTNQSRRIVEEELGKAAVRTIVGQGYYAFVDVGPVLDRAGMADSAALGTRLAEQYGLAVVPGVYFSPFGARWIRFSYALPPHTTTIAVKRLIAALNEISSAR